ESCVRARRALTTSAEPIKKPPHRAGVFAWRGPPLFLALGCGLGFGLGGLVALFLLQAEARELLLEARQTAAAIEELLVPTGPRRVRFRVDIEMQRIALLAPGGAGGEFAAVGHLDRDGVIIRMGVRFHRCNPAAGPLSGISVNLRGSIQDRCGP